jgi:hypothetical protein
MKAKDVILKHANWRIEKFTEVGGYDLEIVQSALEEVADLSAQFVAGKLSMEELEEMTKKAREEHEDGSDT